jgi:hypothetical protein
MAKRTVSSKAVRVSRHSDTATARTAIDGASRWRLAGR